MSLSPESVFPYFFVSWVALGLGGWLYVRSRPDAAAKRQAYRIHSVLAGVVFSGFAIWMVPSAAPMVIPAVTLITWFNLRNTHFCGSCGKMLGAQPFQKAAFCPRCGAALKAMD